jgi:prepilin-type N-terminal cleavage/methylation domain-containing protein
MTRRPLSALKRKAVNTMKKRQSGFTLIELLIAIAVLAIIMAMNSTILQEMMRGTRQQGAIAATQFETALGLEILRADLMNAGHGLIDEVQASIAYAEAVGAPAQLFNDGPSGIPRAIVHNNDVSAYATYLANSDYLAIKSPAVGINDSSGKWSYITGSSVHVWNDMSLDMANDGQQRMIVVVPSTKPDKTARLVVDGANNYAVIYTQGALNAAFQPPVDERYIVYGVDNSNIVRPFNRADYYVRRSASTGTGCASNTGTFIKSVTNQSALGGHTERPLIDCVAAMQVLFRVDTNGDGIADGAPVNSISSYTARQIKENVKEIRVYILAHEGNMDRGFRYAGSSTITLGDPALGAQIDLQALVGANWDRYRWKIYTVNVSPRGFYG